MSGLLDIQMDTSLVRMADQTDANPLIAAAVSRLLREKGIAQRDAADRAGIAFTTFRRRITGASAFDIDELTGLCRVLDVSLAALITYAESAEPVPA